ncbi:hypothetical protein [Actinokineospora terrae]|uniref:Uncharacterized protein n=1 Tax=Actinokineospora terrae TaxID=155974 RepID=A0A1H9P8U2_9PSEU|nr:hypothetical protein [Actinokineospora terrae]SER44638.1 hypothetical protein SAMN04487818_103345 [Actinokineospora terrae]
MVVAVLVWVGAVLGISLLLLMAFGPAIVEFDAWHQARRRRAAGGAGRDR